MVGNAPEQNPALVYLDSNFYFDYLIPNRAGHDTAQAIMDAWMAGTVEVATSALTLTEVLYVKLDDVSERVKFDRSRENDIIDLFRQHGQRRLRLIELDRTTAELARGVYWDHPAMDTKDAVHVASAVKGRCPVMFTRDAELLKISGIVGGNPPLIIEPPHWTIQTTLDLPERK